ncbi:3-deoxy-manno-octulosonate cytidylyltransferase (CMP-KDO synthetase) [Humidesulfovibrio mexicanus]|uniref:3-deoxy-manno-octulosonate cytidylyltransferase n=1 Tax=Humidesulfovibrio mexicanus TaxID=147047 RepID=A0A239BEH6_9BACT|nr:3-deoxy-manno-octulosonate cytidylyltransferase [Humidesulfovibrio mexicanus]SNS06447.1 3-deoxy-manno-octulosonate cytidylyltransferase (CMP-KDO synthetase) [Humidesulfovibrio mexicanus]
MRTLPPCYAIIPARYDSSRFPGKPLVEISGVPMCVRVHQRASLCARFSRVLIATDDERIMAAANAWGAPAIMTGRHHQSGTDRVLEAARLIGAEPDSVVVNVQGDEPALDPAMLEELLAPFAAPGGETVQAATLATPMTRAEAQSPDRVKVVLDAQGRALYFSRAAIPFCRDGEADGDTAGPLLHVGLYAFRMHALERFAALPQGRLERTEKLEQLRLLENAIPIHVALTRHACHGVDRPEDVEHIEKILREHAT